ncbi:MAG: diguanylate cyclase domain-containing protein [Bacillota bacterium]
MKVERSYFFIIGIVSILIFAAAVSYIEAPYLNPGIKEIRVVMDDDFPPYIFRDANGNLMGVLVDEWNLWSIKTGINVNIEGMNWNTAQRLMKEGKYDVIDTMFKNDERSKLYNFSHPYADIEMCIFFNKNISGITDVKSLKGFNVGMKKAGSTINLLKKNGINDYLEFDTDEAIIKAAKNDQISVFIMGKPTALYYLHKYNMEDDFRYTESQLTGQFHRAVKKEDQVLLKAIDYGFSKISEAEHKKIYNKWFGFKYMGSDFTLYIKIYLISVLIIAIVLIFWSITLKRAVRRKTLELTNTIEKLQKSENRINSIFKAMPDLLFILNRNGIFMDYQANDKTKSLYPPEEFLGKSFYEIFDEELSQKFEKTLKDSITSGETQMVEYSIILGEENHYFEARVIQYDVDLILAIVRDITARKLAEIKIYNMSIKDSITGLYNRNYFEKEMEARNAQNLSYCGLIICDLDGLKLINDTLGHTVGDEYLKITADILKVCFDEENTVIARIGGDEFGILMKDITETEIAKKKSKLKTMVEEINNNKAIPVSISLGYAVSLDKARNLREMFKEADDYMYKEKLHHKQSSKSELVSVIMKMLETRDYITEGHCDRLQVLSAKLAAEVGMTDSQIQDILLFSKFHDIGKVGVSDSVLFKPGKLTAEEFEEMKRHCEIGYRIAQSSPDIAHLADWILKHHEWWNGKGYPFGLKEDEIPIQCRILSIVDAYDAMTSDRPYRKALTVEEAINELKRFRGIQFDPQLVDRFLEILLNIEDK